MPDRLQAQEFADALLFSLQSDEGYLAAPDDRNVVIRSDLAAFSVVRTVVLAPDELSAFCENTVRLAERVQDQPMERRVLRTFVVVMCECKQGGTLEKEVYYLPALKNLLQVCEQKGLITDFVLADLYSHTCSAVCGRRITEKKVAKLLRELMAAEEHDFGERVKEKKQTAAMHKIQAGKVREVRPVNPLVFLVLINVIIYFFDIYFNANYGYKPLEEMGIQNNFLIMQGEVWRLFTPMFLHADFAHLAGNMLTLFYLGTITLQYYTVREFFAIYFFSGFVGNLLSLFFTDYLSLGASGAIMGLGGMLIYRMFFGKYAKSFRLAGNYAMFAVMVVFNLFYGVFAVNANINNFGHFGGFAGGFVMAAVIAAVRQRAKTKTKHSAER